MWNFDCTGTLENLRTALMESLDFALYKTRFEQFLTGIAQLSVYLSCYLSYRNPRDSRVFWGTPLLLHFICPSICPTKFRVIPGFPVSLGQLGHLLTSPESYLVRDERHTIRLRLRQTSSTLGLTNPCRTCMEPSSFSRIELFEGVLSVLREPSFSNPVVSQPDSAKNRRTRNVLYLSCPPRQP